MDQILRLLLEHLSFLYKDHEFRIVDSRHSRSFGGNGLIVLTDEIVMIRLVRDREQLFCDFKSYEDRRKKLGWYSIEIVRHFLTSEDDFRSFLDLDNIQFIRDLIADIRRVFMPDNLAETHLELKKITRNRMKQLWG